MGFFTVKTDEENVRDFSGNTKYINKSGMYDLIIKSAIVDVSSGGSQVINLWVENDGQPQMIYNAIRLTNKDGSPNFGQSLFNKLAVVCGATEGSEINDPVSKMLPIGKNGESKECMVLEDFNDIPVVAHIRMEYSLYNGKIMENKVIRNFFRFEDKATASEIVNNAENKGTQYEKESEDADKISYKNGLTEEDVTEWKKNRSKGKEEETESKPAPISFGQKRSFSRT